MIVKKLVTVAISSIVILGAIFHCVFSASNRESVDKKSSVDESAENSNNSMFGFRKIFSEYISNLNIFKRKTSSENDEVAHSLDKNYEGSQSSDYSVNLNDNASNNSGSTKKYDFKKYFQVNTPAELFIPI